MSTTAPFSERVATAVLLALWKQPETTLQHLLRETLAPLPDVQQALALLRDRRCQIEQTPTSIRLAATGLPCWQDVLLDIARRSNLRIGRRVMIFHRTASTNDIAWQAATGGGAVRTTTASSSSPMNKPPDADASATPGKPKPSSRS